MPEENNLADIVSSGKGNDPFKDVKDEEEKDTSTDSPPEKETKKEKSLSSQGEPKESEEESEDESKEESEDKTEDKTEDESEDETKDSKKDKTEKDKQIPFHKHPRWKEREKQFNEKLDTLRQEGDEKLKVALEGIRSTEPKSIPNWFKGLYGDDQEMWNEYRSGQQAERESLKQEILAEQQERQTKETVETQKWNEWIDDEVVKLKADGKSFNKNELLKVALEYKPTDDNGNISLEKSYDLLQILKVKDTKKSTAHKKLADSTISKTKGEQTHKDFKTPEDLKGRSWEDIS